MENSKLSDVKGKELVAAGHAFAKAIGMDTPLIEIAKMVSVLATRLDCALIRGDACMQAEMVWEKAMMAAIGEDGVGCVVRAIAELKAERDALAAENAALARYFSASAGAVEHWNSWADAEDKLAPAPENPATDAYRNSVRAEGVEMFAKELGSPYGDDEGRDYETGFNRAIEVSKSKAAKFVTQLRAGKDGE